MRAAEALSFLKDGEQYMLDEVLGELPAGGKKISIMQADIIKEKSTNEELSKSSIIEIQSPISKQKKEALRNLGKPHKI